jgi:hypothetical protein
MAKTTHSLSTIAQRARRSSNDSARSRADSGLFSTGQQIPNLAECSVRLAQLSRAKNAKIRVSSFSCVPAFQIRFNDMRTVALPDCTLVPALGQGTWRMGESKSARATGVAALRLGIELGMNLIDTAEMYGDAERKRLSLRRYTDNGQTFLWLRKFIRAMRHVRNCQKRVSAVLSASASTRLTFIFCTGASEHRRSRKPWTRSRSCALPER